ncbi:MAG: DUF389 domain-containing protein [Armatimonadota bacterium]|nr:DUF389 domain-containing protein [Armatimonadota bacterium]
MVAQSLTTRLLLGRLGSSSGTPSHDVNQYDQSDMRPGTNEEYTAIRESIAERAAFSSAYVTMNALAAVIASYGLLQDSSAVVIGAMIVALLLDPLMGIALALVDANNSLLRKALLTEIGGVAIVFAISIIIGRIHQDIPIGRAIISRTAPNIMDLVIALAGGAAGAYTAISPRVSTSLVGVAIATALVPPLCTSGLLFARGETHLALGAFLLFFANLVAIQISSSFVFWLHGYHEITGVMRLNRRVLLLHHGPSVALLIALVVILGLNFKQSMAARRFEIDVRNVLTREIASHPGSFLADLRIDQKEGKTLVTAVVRTPFSFGPGEVASMQRKLPANALPVELHIRSVITKEASPTGWLHELPSALPQVEAGPPGD